MGRGDKQSKASQQAIRGYNSRMPQTQSAAKGSVSKFGYHTSRQPSDEPTAVIRTGMGARNRNPAKITLAPMPWDKET